MKVAASAGLGFTMVHSVDKVALQHFGLRAIATVKECASDFHAITIARRLKRPVVAAITEHASSELFARQVHLVLVARHEDCEIGHQVTDAHR